MSDCPVLAVYANKVIDWYVAESVEEAKQLARVYMRESLGMSPDEIESNLDFEPCNPRDWFTVINWKNRGEDYGYTDQFMHLARLHGKGFLASTEY